MGYLASNDLKKKICQLLVVRASGHLLDSQRKYPFWELSNKELKTLLENGLGGVILHGGSIFELKKRCKILNGWANHSILLCADVEEGVGQRFEGGSWLPPPMTLGLKYIEDSEEATFLAEKQVLPSPAPAYGEHTEEILSELGFGSKEISRLRNANAVI